MADKPQKRLLEILSSLPEDKAVELMEYAEFLYARHAVEQDISEPNMIPRPEKETVVNAIKRMTATYPMLKSDKLLNETSVFMMRYLLQGEDAAKVIDDLEDMFKNHYERLLEKKVTSNK